MAYTYTLTYDANGNPYIQRAEGWGRDLTSWFGLKSDPIADALNARFGTGLSEDQWQNIINQYVTESTKDMELFGNKFHTVDVSKDLSNDVESLLNALSSRPEAPNKESFLDSARATASELYSGMLDEYNALDANRLATHQAEMQNITTGYDQLRSNLLTSQYQRNAQLMDSLQSGMERSRRNALEAGASAGIRIADNINTLLSVQNKQSATSMETANQLSQMMINQRNAEAESRRSYDDYMSQSKVNKDNLKREQEGYAQNLANANYNAAYDSYAKKQTDWDSANAYNPLYNYRGEFEQASKSKYSKGGV